jgi:hypothetical protein
MDPLEQYKLQMQQSLTPEEQFELPSKTAALGSIMVDQAQGKNPRQILYESIQSQGTKLGDERSKILQNMASGNQMSKSETAAMLFIGLLPTLVGGLAKGKKGISMGAEAGALGTQVMAKGITADSEKRDLQGKLALQSIDNQIERNSDTQSKIQLGGIEQQEKAGESALDREARLDAAGIRAGGEMAAGKAQAQATNNQVKELKRQNDLADKNARTRPVTFQGKVFMDDGSSTDKDTEKRREVIPAYQTVDENLTKMIQLYKGMDLAKVKAAWGDSGSELGQRRELLLKAFEKIEKVPGTMGNAGLERLRSVVADPSSGWQNFVSMFPVNADLDTKLNTTKKIIGEQFTQYMKNTGMSKSMAIGTPKMFPGETKPRYFIGVNEDGQRIYTANRDKVLDAMEGVE